MGFFKIILSCLLLTLMTSELTFGLDKYQQQCTEASSKTTEISPNQTTTIITTESCDTTLFLACKGGRCGCVDSLNHIYTSREFKTSDLRRNKRSPGKGKGKISTGKAVIGGAAIGVVGYGIGSAVANAGSNNNNGGSSGSRGDGGSSDSKSHKKIIVYSCYTRVQGDCVIDTKRVTLFENATSVKDGNSTTTTIVKQAIDYSHMHPLCISHAECKPKRIPGQDTNIGECICKDGYKKTSTDICVSSVERITAPAGVSIIFSILLAHFYILK